MRELTGQNNFSVLIQFRAFQVPAFTGTSKSCAVAHIVHKTPQKWKTFMQLGCAWQLQQCCHPLEPTRWHSAEPRHPPRLHVRAIDKRTLWGGGGGAKGRLTIASKRFSKEKKKEGKKHGKISRQTEAIRGSRLVQLGSGGRS